jgi:maltose alpha-D-glucosyltransferase/alpha-amylase
MLETTDERVFAHRCDWKNGSIIAIHNLSDQPAIWCAPEEENASLIALTGDRMHEPVEGGEQIELSAYSFRWFRVTGPGRQPA